MYLLRFFCGYSQDSYGFNLTGFKSFLERYADVPSRLDLGKISVQFLNVHKNSLHQNNVLF